MQTKKMLVDFKKDYGYRCPICGQIIQPTDDDGYILDPDKEIIYKVTPCPHLIWINSENSYDQRRFELSFSYVRTDITQKIVKLIREDPATQYRLEKRRIKVSERSISYFLNGKYEFEDRISELFAQLPIAYDQLLPPNTTTYQYVYSEYSKMEFAIETL